MCCGSLEVAATALFKTLSGLRIKNLTINPAEFAEQWEHLENEVIEDGDSDHWQLTHPFPPLRMKAMMIFWDSGFEERTWKSAVRVWGPCSVRLPGKVALALVGLRVWDRWF